MRDFPSCFGESGVQIADSSSSSSSSTHKSAHNLVTCLYQAPLGRGGCWCLITITWTKNLMGQGLGVSVEEGSTNRSLGRLDIKPWLFSKKKGSKSLELGDSKMDVFWDLSSARFGPSPEPLEGFYVAILFDLEMVLLLGDMSKEAYRKTGTSLSRSNTLFVAKKEHLFGKKMYFTKAQFCGNGKVHDIAIECEMVGLNDPCLEIRIDRKRVMQVKRLVWKFRGNHTILVDGVPVEVFWDVHNWLFDPAAGNAVFMFQTSLSADDKLSPWSCSQVFGEAQRHSFSLVLIAWKNE
ncbi:uncharacterized protein M6B38_283950 [Iris pallida]|uniref:DUF868 domain-containing protein n=1 Tax=Iris pallida TaxID=29817 RepID=A0AAX6I1P1_IRIPA|nr:uncharacterized protein M6B38_283950 [Iris pallida]